MKFEPIYLKLSRNSFRYAESDSAAPNSSWTPPGGGPNRWRGGSSLWGHPVFDAVFCCRCWQWKKNRDELHQMSNGKKHICSLLNNQQNEQEGEGWAPTSSWFFWREATNFFRERAKFFWLEHGRSRWFFFHLPQQKNEQPKKLGSYV